MDALDPELAGRPRRRWRWALLAAPWPLLLPLAWVAAEARGDPAPEADLAVVLGSKVYPSGEPSPLLRERLQRALELYEGGRAEFLLVSGGLGKEGHQEARVMAEWLIARGVPRERVLEDPAGNTTHATALNAARLMRERGWDSAWVVSQYYHLARCKLAMRRAGVDEVAGAAAVWNPTSKEPYSLAREAAGLYYYLLRRDF